VKLGVSMWSYYTVWKRGDIDISSFIRTVRNDGAEGVELLDFFWKDREAETKAVEKTLAETSTPVGVYSVSNNFVNADADIRAGQVNVIRSGVDSANHFGAKVVRVFAGNYDEKHSFGDAFAWIVEGLKAASDYAGNNGVTLALENHGRLAGRSNQVREIIEAVNSPALRANPDTGNFLLVHQAPHEAVKELAGLAAMVHFKDFTEVPASHDGFAYVSLDGLKYVGTAIGDGEVALAECVDELVTAGFDGWLNIEYEGSVDPTIALPTSIINARRLLGK
jgi:sugar phosphate isomerase/epimerase